MIGLTQVELVALLLAISLGISLGILGSGVYANWRLRRVTSGLDSNGTMLQQLLHERANYVNELVDVLKEVEALRQSSARVFTRIEGVKRSIETTSVDTEILDPIRNLKLSPRSGNANVQPVGI